MDVVEWTNVYHVLNTFNLRAIKQCEGTCSHKPRYWATSLNLEFHVVAWIGKVLVAFEPKDIVLGKSNTRHNMESRSMCIVPRFTDVSIPSGNSDMCT